MDFQVRRDDLPQRRFVAQPAVADTPLAGGFVLLRVDRFAFTANNVSYAALGDAMSYWDFFPAPEGWGRIPAWGFGTVVRSACDEVAEGTRYYGYFPMSAHVALQPERVTATTFTDGVPHRAALHRLYNQYTLAPAQSERADALQMLLRPLFITSFVLDDLLDDNAFFGARRIVISSASSKTAYGMAFLLASRAREGGAPIELIALTSPRNAAFVAGLGWYDRVLTYDAVTSLPDDAPAAYVDFASDAGLRAAVHRRLDGALRWSCGVGYTHWGRREAEPSEALPGPQPSQFFAPVQIRKRAQDWGPGGFERRLDAAWQRFVAALGGHDAGLRVTYGNGPDALARVYDEALAGTLRPEEGHVLSLA